jgi:hypothetical protein
MPQAQNITLTHNAVNTICKPRSVNAGLALMQADHADGVSHRTGISVKNRLANGSQGQLTKIAILVPVTETVDGVQKVVREARMFIEIPLAADATKTEAEEILSFGASALADATVVAVVSDFEQVL